MDEELADLESYFCGLNSDALNSSLGAREAFNFTSLTATTASFDQPCVSYSTLPNTTATENISQPINTVFQQSLYMQIDHILSYYVIVGICVFGLIGNVLNLVVLVPKSSQYGLGRIEQFAYMGLIALSVSDMCFCVAVIPHAFVDQGRTSDTVTFSMLYETYKDGFFNTFILTSTWLTVILALGRYVAICHPLQARKLIGPSFAKRLLPVVFALGAAINIPRFWNRRIVGIHCPGISSLYFSWTGLIKRYPAVHLTYVCAYSVVAVFVPLLTLFYCNCHLVLALRRSRSTREQLRATTQRHGEANPRITVILVAIVLFYIVLVSPAEMIIFFEQFTFNHSMIDEYNLGVTVANMLQALNFALNFVLYYALSAPFRRGALALAKCDHSCSDADARQRRFSRYNSSTLSSRRVSSSQSRLRGAN